MTAQSILIWLRRGSSYCFLFFYGSEHSGSIKCGNFWTGLGNISCSWRTRLHGVIKVLWHSFLLGPNIIFTLQGQSCSSQKPVTYSSLCFRSSVHTSDRVQGYAPSRQDILEYTQRIFPWLWVHTPRESVFTMRGAVTQYPYCTFTLWCLKNIWINLPGQNLVFSQWCADEKSSLLKYVVVSTGKHNVSEQLHASTFNVVQFLRRFSF